MAENKTYEKLMHCLSCIREKTDFVPKVALVLGSGLGNYGEKIKVETAVSYHDIEGFPVSTVAGHKGQFLFGRVGEVPVVCMQGRVHYYEGYDISDVVLPIRLMKLLGAEILFLTNAAGGLQDGMSAGDFMLIRDHISCFAPNPLIGSNIDELGERFPDMSEVYDYELARLIRKNASSRGILLKEGVYAQLTGPSFESPAEITMLKRLGVDAVGMSTVVEAIAAKHMGMRVCGISCICNLAAGISKNPLSHEEVQAAGKAAAPLFEALVSACVEDFG
ncbi:MAG: purine-nucleoside phosphorylase [bacterium]|nr:purine-nucleoside phosphorylase [bacterium]